MPSAHLSPDVASVAAAVRAGRLSPVELTRGVLDEIARVDPRLTAFLHVGVNAALEDARRVERAVRRGRDPGPLAGVPISIKDLAHVRGMPTTAGSHALDGEPLPAADAPVVGRLRRAGAIILGKANLHEVALGVTSANEHYGAVRNPWDTTRVAGGSSGGSAAAVACGLGLASLGTDTRGSIRIPASCCGITGLKPTQGLVPIEGILPLSPTLDHAGPMTRSVADAALVLAAMTGSRRALERFTRALRAPTRRLVVGVSTYHLRDTDARVLRVVRRAIAVIRGIVRDLRDVAIPGLEGTVAQEASGVITGTEAFAFHQARLAENPSAYGPLVRGRLMAGGTRSAVEYVRALAAREVLTRGFATTFETVDVLVGATLPALPPRIDQPSATINDVPVNVVEAFTRFNAPQNMAGIPALSVPCGFVDGLPVGLQIIAPHGRDDLVLTVGAAYQRLTDWHQRRPDPLA
jgi:aspartyl-tRNA(Asn)/glutamyl-tRNA(Gln) amidotransferase subunit A